MAMCKRGNDGNITERLERKVEDAEPDATIVNVSSVEYHARQLLRIIGGARGKGLESAMTVISSIEQLEASYGFRAHASTVKVAARVTLPYRVPNAKSPFAALTTSG